MNLRAFDLNLLTVFDAIYEARNMSRAAERIGLSQPAMSLALGRLRQVVGDPLFVRRAGAMQPTPRAQQLSGPIRSALDTVATSLLRQSAFDYASSDRTFRLSLGDYGALLILPRLAQLLEELGAGVRLQASAHSGLRAEEDLASGALDLSMTFYPVVRGDLRAQMVYSDTLSVLARHGHPGMREGLTVEQYCALRHVIGAWPRGRGLRPGERELFDRSLQRNETIVVDSFLYMPSIIAASDIIGTMPTRMARRFAEIYGLRVWPTPVEGGEPARVYLNSRRADEDDEGRQWLRSTIIDLFGRL